MSHFLNLLDSRDIDERAGLFQLLVPLVYVSDLLGELVTVPEGFISDGASVPRLPFAYLVVGGKGKRAAVVHDWLYTTQRVTRKQADDVFAEALAACGYGKVTTGLMWSGVRIGGASHWKAPNVPQPERVQPWMQEAA